MTNHRADVPPAIQRLLLTDLVPLLAGYGITAEIHQLDEVLEPYAEIRYGTVHTHVEIYTGSYTAFGGVRLAPTDDPDSAARRIASLCGMPSVPASDPP